MKAKITKRKHESYGCTFNVAYLSYDMVAGTDFTSNDIIAAQFEEVKFIFDADWEKDLIIYREILNVKKPKKASYYMYYAVLQSIGEHLGKKLKELTIIDDADDESKKVWIKKIRAVADNSPIEIDVVGKNYSNTFDIKVCDLDRDEFIRECEGEIGKLKIGLENQTKRINGLVCTVHNLKKEKVYTSTHALNVSEA